MAYSERQPRQDVVEEQSRNVIDIGSILTSTNNEQFTLLSKLGKGGHSEVYQMRNERNGLEQAIKFVRFDIKNLKVRREVMARAEQEVKILGKINNPFILSSIDAVRFQTDSGEVLGFITDLVEGNDLNETIVKDGKMNPRRVVRIIGEMLVALESLRKAGLVHRDIKPGNIIIEKLSNGEEIAQLIDFGLTTGSEDIKETQPVSRERIQTKKGITQKGVLLGTSDYMAPEQFTGKKPTHRTDLYSLGLVFYEMLAGEQAITEDATAFVRYIENTWLNPKSLKRLGVNISKELNEVLLKMIQKKPEHRFETAADALQALKAVVTKDYPELMHEIPFIWDMRNTDNYVKELAQKSA